MKHFVPFLLGYYCMLLRCARDFEQAASTIDEIQEAEGGAFPPAIAPFYIATHAGSRTIAMRLRDLAADAGAVFERETGQALDEDTALALYVPAPAEADDE